MLLVLILLVLLVLILVLLDYYSGFWYVLVLRFTTLYYLFDTCSILVLIPFRYTIRLYMSLELVVFQVYGVSQYGV